MNIWYSHLPEGFIVPKLRLYPIPANETLMIVSDLEMEFELYNLNGQILIKGLLLPGENNIDLRELAGGLYYFKAGGQTHPFIHFD